MPSPNALLISLPLSLLLAPSIIASPIPIPPELEYLGDLKTPSMPIPTPVQPNLENLNDLDNFDHSAPQITPHFATPSINPHPLAETSRPKGHVEGSNLITALLKDSILVDSLPGHRH
ncbi:hypothetical protein VTN00DRAFT_11 [Thermoascus crustaceus]|uniref:uncharacterized protein n=1 Tax=Thermoascus crustaceus TaxID=5088 RepID=UPI003743C10F